MVVDEDGISGLRSSGGDGLQRSGDGYGWWSVAKWVDGGRMEKGRMMKKKKENEGKRESAYLNSRIFGDDQTISDNKCHHLKCFQNARENRA